MSTEPSLDARIESAADAVGAAWPLHSFVTANPLAGFEDQPFHEAVDDARSLLGGAGYPSADVFRRAWRAGRIDSDVLSRELAAHGYEPDPEAALERLATVDERTPIEETTATDRVDAVLSKWLSAFLDQGLADWSMPNREDGFYDAFRTVAPYDDEIPDGDALASLPADPLDAVRDVLAAAPGLDPEAVFEHQFAALPGWTGYLKQRASDDGAWQATHPITLPGYLAARLALASAFDASLTAGERSSRGDDGRVDTDRVPLQAAWLDAWEATYRTDLVDSLVDERTTTRPDDARPDAQLVFCIDTRSEIIRRHVEAAGDYETHGYAGFFGVPMRYAGYGDDVTVDACPPILDARHRIEDAPVESTADARAEYDRWQRAIDAATSALERLKTNAATAFNLVESTGVGYGAALAARTLVPGRVFDLSDAAAEQVPADHEFCEPQLDSAADAEADDSGARDAGEAERAGPHDAGETELPVGLTLAEQVEYAATAFELMGWETFARVVGFVGHASHTTNNPFESSLDCGACAGNPGGPSARVLAAICNDDAVRSALRDRDIHVPADTVFVAGEHDTTTDAVELYDDAVPESHAADLERLRAALATARAGAATERAADLGVDADAGVRETERRAADWAETRPEWGLAGNAAFVVGPRALTAALDLDGRAFLHSYDWSTDPDGDALEAILAGPMVVTQWINAQYYFATVDTAAYGSGSKVTHNPTGNVGVYQGNGGDLMTGLPLQSVMAAADDPYHQPLRLSTVVHAPVERVTDVLAAHDDVAELLDNDWLSLTVVDPEQDHQAFHYQRDLRWTSLATETDATPAVSTTPTPVDD